MNLSYDLLKSLLVSVVQDGHVLKCVFQAPGQVWPLEARFVWIPEDNEECTNVNEPFITNEEIEQGVINAFKNIQELYRYENGQWIYLGH